jgi:hypothetical protein
MPRETSLCRFMPIVRYRRWILPQGAIWSFDAKPYPDIESVLGRVVGMLGDRAAVVFAVPEEIHKVIEARC